MRLDPVEKKALEEVLKDVDDEVYLFGSRVDDAKHGGDIDLLIFSEKDPFELSRKVAVDFFMECEEKLDVVVMSPNHQNAAEGSFLKNLKLEKWK